MFADATGYVNLTAERSISDYLIAHPDLQVMHVMATPQLAGVIDSISAGRLQTVDVVRYLLGCNPEADNRPEATHCLVTRWGALLEAQSGRALRVVLPAEAAAADLDSKRFSFLPSLKEAAGQHQYTVAPEAEFATNRGVPALVVYRVTATPTQSAQLR